MQLKPKEILAGERVRKTYTNIDALAADIEANGLINPVSVMEDGGVYKLIAGMRRLKAVQLLGWDEIPVHVLPPRDAHAALLAEISENEQREAFTFSEQVDYARRLKEIEAAKAHERKVESGKIYGEKHPQEVEDRGPQPLRRPQSRDAVGAALGMSGRQVGRALYIADHAPPEVIDELDRGERSVNSVYEELRAEETEAPRPAPAPDPNLLRAATAESELQRLQYDLHNMIFHRDSEISCLKKQLEAAERKLAGDNDPALDRQLEQGYEELEDAESDVSYADNAAGLVKPKNGLYRCRPRTPIPDLYDDAVAAAYFMSNRPGCGAESQRLLELFRTMNTRITALEQENAALRRELEALKGGTA